MQTIALCLKSPRSRLTLIPSPDLVIPVWLGNKRGVALQNLRSGLKSLDLDGYYTPSPTSYHYFLAFVDDLTRYVWAWLLKTKDKSATSKAIKESLAFVWK